MPLCDITGRIHNGMRKSTPPFPSYHLRHIPQPDWVEHPVFMEAFEGFHSQTGTYLETPAHWYGDASYPLYDVPVQRLFDIPCRLLWLGTREPNGTRMPITGEDIDRAVAAAGPIPAGCALLVGCGWGQYWDDPRHLLESPFFTREAMARLIALRPFLLGTDYPAWENRDNPQNFFEDFYSENILMLAPVVNLEKLPKEKPLLLTALPLAIEGTSCIPCRAVVRWEEPDFYRNELP